MYLAATSGWSEAMWDMDLLERVWNDRARSGHVSWRLGWGQERVGVTGGGEEAGGFRREALP